ncbi:excalibur calcium-binding domain-containing protein [Streptomyces nanshensis]|uniref:Excalibur calcium-binding domain-containing protein n=1 Tax=Streptomyces nanshensis TaxID=518642 RepID=A0A1E7L096_9ACTN|nr:excalibur calcium-binding domain-containing protein [Streptomyces nanshensis]OEV09596.1 hypothetical protein AN218_21320 [Streptomyces nanshensis]
MTIRATAVAVAAAGALGLALTPSVAVAHDGSHPFKNCSAAYAAGYRNIPQGDVHYGAHLDRDGDGVGCDKPPKGFKPVRQNDRSGGSDGSGGAEKPAASDGPAKQDGGHLAETGGGSTTPYVAATGGLVLLAGAGVLVASRARRRTDG